MASWSEESHPSLQGKGRRGGVEGWAGKRVDRVWRGQGQRRLPTGRAGHGDSGRILRAIELDYWSLSPLKPALVASRRPQGTLKRLFSSLLIPDCRGLGMPCCANVRINPSLGGLVLGKAQGWAMSTSAHRPPAQIPRPARPPEPGERTSSLFLSVMPSVQRT